MNILRTASLGTILLVLMKKELNRNEFGQLLSFTGKFFKTLALQSSQDHKS